MPLTEDQREWIKEISGVSADGWAEREKARAEVLAGVRTETLEVKYEVRELIKFTVKSGKKEIASLLTDQSDRWEADEVEVGTRHTRVASPPEEEWSTAQVEIVVAL